MPFDPGAVGSTNHPKMDTDFAGKTVPQDGRAVPGPLQSLKKGDNVFRVWQGLPILAQGELPKPEEE